MIKTALAFFGLAGLIYAGLAWFNAGSPGVDRLASMLGAPPAQVASAAPVPPPLPAQNVLGVTNAPAVASPAVENASLVIPAAATTPVPTPPALAVTPALAQKITPPPPAALQPQPTSRPVVLASSQPVARNEQPRVIASRPSATTPETSAPASTPNLVSMVAASRTPLEPAPVRTRRPAPATNTQSTVTSAPVVVEPVAPPPAPKLQPKPQGPEL